MKKIIFFLLVATVVLGQRIRPSEVKGYMLEDSTITADKIATGVIGNVNIADGSIDSSKIATGAVQTSDVADASITSAKIATGTVTQNNLNAALSGEIDKIKGNSSYKEIDSLGLYDWLKSGGNDFFYRPKQMGYYFDYLAQTVRGGADKDYTVVVDGPAHSIGAYGYQLAKSMWNVAGYGGLGFISLASTSNPYASTAECAVTLTGSWTSSDQSTNDVLWGINGNSITATGADSVTVTFVREWRYARIWYDGAAGTSFSCSINGVAVDTIITNETGLQYVQYDAASASTHTFSIGNVSGAVTIYGVEVWGSYEGVGYVPQLLYNGGSRADEADDHMEYFTDFLEVVDPALIMIMHDVNDYNQGASTSDLQGYLTTIIDSIQASVPTVPIITVSSNPGGNPTKNDSLRAYKQAHFNLSKTKGTGFLNFFDMFSSHTDMLATGTGDDDTHPNTQGYEKISYELRSALSNKNGYNVYASKIEDNAFVGHNTFSTLNTDPNATPSIYTYQGGVQGFAIGNTNQFHYLAANKRYYFGVSSTSTAYNPTLYYFISGNTDSTFRISSNVGSAIPLYARMDNFTLGTSTVFRGSQRRSLSMFLGTNVTGTPGADIATLSVKNPTGGAHASFHMYNEDGVGGFPVHDLGLTSPATLDTTWSTYDGMLRIWVPALNDTVSIPFKY